MSVYCLSVLLMTIAGRSRFTLALSPYFEYAAIVSLSFWSILFLVAYTGVANIPIFLTGRVLI